MFFDADNGDYRVSSESPMIDAGAKVLVEAGVSEKSMFFDKFEDARSPAPIIDNSKWCASELVFYLLKDFVSDSSLQ